MYKFRVLLTKEQVFTIPNFMSFFRLVLIPFILWTYLREEYSIAAGLLLLSAVTDIFDGMIARKFNMVSDLGKVLDPFCDKLTHAALLICLLTRFPYVWPAFVLLAFKELATCTLGAIAVRRHATIHGAEWYGKVCTVVFECSMFVLFLFPEIPERVMLGILGLCCVMMLFSLIMYAIFFLRIICGKGNPAQGETESPGGTRV